MDTKKMDTKKMENESSFEWKKRLSLAKLNKELDLDWCEIVEVLGLDIHYDTLRRMAYGYKEYDEYLSDDGVRTRILSISDTHVPFQLPIETFKDYVGRVDILQLNGDILDCQSISKFPKAYRVSMLEEMIEGRQYMLDLINYLKPKKVVVNYGNHELRFQAYMSRNMDDDVLQLMPQTALDLICTDGFHHYNKRNGSKIWYEPLVKVLTDIEFIYTEDWKCQIGDTVFCHPSAFKSGMMATAERAMTWFRNEGYNFRTLVMSHTHRVGEYVVGNTTLYEQGTCSDVTQQHYCDGRMVNSQKEGFLYICQDENGNTIKDKCKLVCLN